MKVSVDADEVLMSISIPNPPGRGRGTRRAERLTTNYTNKDNHQVPRDETGIGVKESGDGNEYPSSVRKHCAVRVLLVRSFIPTLRGRGEGEDIGTKYNQEGTTELPSTSITIQVEH